MSTPWVIAVVALWVTVLLIAIVLLGLLRRIAVVLERAEGYLASPQGGVELGLPVGSQAGDFRLRRADEDEVNAEGMIRRPTILLFMETNCGPCRLLAKGLEGVTHEIADVPLLIVLDDGGAGEWLPAELNVVHQEAGEISRAFQNSATPQAYLIDENRFILDKRLIGSVSSLTELAQSNAAKGGEVAKEHALLGVRT